MVHMNGSSTGAFVCRKAKLSAMAAIASHQYQQKRQLRNRGSATTRSSVSLATDRDPARRASNDKAKVGRQTRAKKEPLVRRHLNRRTFPVRLFELLESGEHSNAISWSQDGTKVCIWNKQQLEKILPKYFKHSKLRSFHRQCSYWGISRHQRTTETEVEVWYHDFLCRGQRDQVKLIIRGENKRVHSASTTGVLAVDSLLKKDNGARCQGGAQRLNQVSKDPKGAVGVASGTWHQPTSCTPWPGQTAQPPPPLPSPVPSLIPDQRTNTVYKNGCGGAYLPIVPNDNASTAAAAAAATAASHQNQDPNLSKNNQDPAIILANVTCSVQVTVNDDQTCKGRGESTELTGNVGLVECEKTVLLPFPSFGTTSSDLFSSSSFFKNHSNTLPARVSFCANEGDALSSNLEDLLHDDEVYSIGWSDPMETLDYEGIA